MCYFKYRPVTARYPYSPVLSMMSSYPFFFFLAIVVLILISDSAVLINNDLKCVKAINIKCEIH